MSEISEVLLVAIGELGSQAKLGQAAGYSQNAIHHAVKVGRVTGPMAVAIEKATKGKVPRWKLCPDLWPKPPRAKPSSPPADKQEVAA